MLNGVLAVWKPKGMTSHDVVFKLRKILQMKRIGHTGTLDPQVDGVLVVCLGQATKIVQLLMDSHKVYTGEITLGYSTETEDAGGQLVERTAVKEPLSEAEIDKAMQTFLGTIEQIPPMYSAVKVKGKRLYEYARAGEEVERPVREAEIYEFERTSKPVYEETNQTQRWKFNVNCGKGTYVRTLAVDLGDYLGYPAHMSQLTRKATSGLTEKEALTLEEIQLGVDEGTIEQHIYPIEKVIPAYDRIDLSEEDYIKVIHGQVLPVDYFGSAMSDLTSLFYEDRLAAIYYPHPTKAQLIKPFIMFNN